MKNRFLFILLLLPFFSFGVDEWRVYPFFWDSNSGSTPKGEGAYFCRCPTNCSPLVAYFSSTHVGYSPWFGVTLFADSNSSLYYPTLANAANVVSTKSASKFIFNSVESLYYSPMAFSELQSLYVMVSTLFSSGYRGPGVQFVGSDNSYIRFNFSPSIVLSDVLFGTNTLYRSQVVSFLSSISSSSTQLVANSLAGLDSFSSFVRDYRNLNYYSFSTNSTYTPLPAVIEENPFFWYGDSSYSSRVMDSLNSDFDLFYNDPAAVARRSSFNRALDSLFTDSLRAYLLDQSSGIDNPFQDYVSNPSMAQSVIAGHFSTPTTNAVMQGAKKISDDVRESLSNNTQQIKKQLADWHNFASNGVKEVNGNLSTIAGNTSPSSLKSAIESSNIHIGDSVTVTLDGPVNIDSEQFNSVSVPLKSLKETADNWYSQWADFYFSSSPEKGWLNFFDLVSDFKEVNHSDLLSIESCVSNLLVSFSSYTNGLPFAISNAIAGLSLSSTNSYLLLSDYADYIHSGGLDSLLDIMDDDSYSDLKAEVGSLYHADTAEGYGRWWRYFTGLSTVQANSIFKLSNIFQAHEKLLKDLKRDNSDLDVQDASDSSVFRKLLYTIPSEDDTFNKLSQLTNSIDQSGMVRVQQLIPDLTNSFNSAASLFDKDFVLPSEISWTLIPGDSSINSPSRVVTICPSQHYRLFQMLHFGLAFSYCLVNIILFPKFLLFLVRLFDRVWNKSEKLIYNSTQS